MNTNHLPKDLVWDLSTLRKPISAGKFFRAFDNSFFVYSRTVNKLYSEYNSFITGHNQHRLVILPDFNQFHSIYHDIPERCIEPTDIFAFAKRDERGNAIMTISGQAKASGQTITLDFIRGLRAIRMGYFSTGAFYPVLSQGDLRELPDRSSPYLRFNRVNIGNLTHKSSFDRSQIEKNIWLKLGARFPTALL